MSSDNDVDIKDLKKSDKQVKNFTISDDDLQIYKDFIDEFKAIVPILESKTPIKNTDDNRGIIAEFSNMLVEILESIQLVIDHIDSTTPGLFDEEEEGDEDEDEVEVDTGFCEYVLTRGKNKGSKCGVMAAPNSNMCKKHTKKEEKDK